MMTQLTNMVIKRTKLVVVSGFLSVLAGCTWPANIYVRNLSEREHILTIDYRFDTDSLSLIYTPDTPEIRFNLYKKFTKQLAKTKDGATYRFIIPAHSTVSVEPYAPNLCSLRYRSVKLDGKDLLDSMGSYRNIEAYHRKWKFGGAEAFWLEIK